MKLEIYQVSCNWIALLYNWTHRKRHWVQKPTNAISGKLVIFLWKEKFSTMTNNDKYCLKIPVLFSFYRWIYYRSFEESNLGNIVAKKKKTWLWLPLNNILSIMALKWTLKGSWFCYRITFQIIVCHLETNLWKSGDSWLYKLLKG